MNETKMLNEIYIVRHAAPQQGTNIAYDRVPGPPLAELGRSEARAAALYLSNCGIEKLYTSPLDRARETAGIIAEETGLASEIVEDIREMRYDEPYEQVRERMTAFLARVDADTADSIAFVSHGSPVRAVLQILSKDTLDLTPYNFHGGNPLPTAGIWRAVREGGAWKLELIFEPARVEAR
jgi:broad specificity phosphatase PhoE